MPNKTVVLFLVIAMILPAVSVAQGKSVYELMYEIGYEGGLSQGKSDREEGYSYSPEVALNEWPIQMALQAYKEKIGHSEEEVDRGFRDGYFKGYKEGYYGR